MDLALLKAGIARAGGAAMPGWRTDLSRWHRSGELTDDQYVELWTYTEICEHEIPPERRKSRVGSRARSAASIRRRRQFGSSGNMPPQIRELFSEAERSALDQVVIEIRKGGLCKITIDEIAGRAGVGRTSAKNALRVAEAKGLIWVERRRRGHKRNDPNTIRIIDPAWIAWLKVGKTGMREAANVAIATLANQVSVAPPSKTQSLYRGPMALRNPEAFGGPSSSGAWRPYF